MYVCMCALMCVRVYVCTYKTHTHGHKRTHVHFNTRHNLDINKQTNRES